MLIRRGLAVLLSLACTLGSAVAAVDQENLPGNLFLNSQAFEWQQEVVVGTSGLLTGVDLWTHLAPGSFRVYLNRGAGWQSDAHDFSVLVSPAASSELHLDVSAAGLVFAAGDTFVIGVQGNGPTNDCCGVYASLDDTYTAGRLFFGFIGQVGEVYDFSGRAADLAFRTHVNAVPEPETVALMVAGLLAVGVAARRKGREASGPSAR